MKKVLTYIVLLSGALFVLFTVNQKVQASQLNFNVEAVIPENQVDKSKTYYDLRIEPKQTQELKMVLNNSTDKDVTVQINVEAATTNINGVVEYGKTKVKKDSTLKTSLSDIVTISEKNPKIPANGKKEITLAVEMPSDDFDGLIAGGVTIKEKDSISDESVKESKGMAIENKYSYVLAMILHGKEDLVSSKVKLNEVKAGQVNVRNVINANIQNTEAKYMNQVSVDAKIYKKGESKTLYSLKKDQMQMAPNSNFNFPISLNGDALKAGDYVLKMKVESQKDSWDFVRNFSISNDEAKKLNDQDVSIEKNNIWIYIAVGTALILLIIGLIYFIIRKRKMEKKKLEREIRRLKSQRRKAKRKSEK